MTPWNSIQSMEFCQPEYWSRFPSPEDLPNPGIEPRSPALQMDSLPAGEPKNAGVGSSSLLQQISPTQESNQDLLHHRHSSPPELPISYTVSTVYKCGPQSPNLSHPPFPPWRPHVCPLQSVFLQGIISPICLLFPSSSFALPCSAFGFFLLICCLSQLFLTEAPQNSFHSGLAAHSAALW